MAIASLLELHVTVVPVMAAPLASLVVAINVVVAPTRIGPVGCDTVTLTTAAGAPVSAGNRFVLTASKPGTIWLNLVSLFDLTDQLARSTALESGASDASARHRRNYEVLCTQVRQILAANGLTEIPTGTRRGRVPAGPPPLASLVHDLSMTSGDELGKMHFTRMDAGTDADFAVLERVHEHNLAVLPDLLLGLLGDMRSDEAYPVDRLDHSLQTATRARRDGADDELVVCALLHDIGDTLGSFNHPDIAAAILKPFVSEDNLWMVQHHGIFQGYYFFHHIGLDRHLRDQFSGHAHYERTAEFCELYDNPAFDAKAETLPIGEFEPMVRRVFAQPRNSIYKGSTAVAGGQAATA